MFRQSLKGLAGAATTAGFGGVFKINRVQCDPEQDPIPLAEKGDSAFDYVGVFLDQASRSKVDQVFGTSSSSKAPHVTLHFNPSEADFKKYESVFGEDVHFEIQAVAQDEHVKTAVVKVVEPESLDYGTNVLHLTLSVKGTEGYDAAYSNVLFERLMSEKILEEKHMDDERVDLSLHDFEGDLPTFHSTLFPYYSPYPATKGKVEILDEPIRIQGKLCVKSKYEVESHTCASSAGECGFCLFMRAGPCGSEFTNWEACLDRCKKNNQDFIEHCGPETLKLRDCVDAHPEYYAVLKEEEEEEKEEEEKSKNVDETPTMNHPERED